MVLHILTILSAALLSFGLTRWFIDLAETRGWMDIPNERSSHKKPVALGGGIVVVGVLCVVWPVLAWPMSPAMWALLAIGASLAGLSWADDRMSLPRWLRFVAQTLAVLAMLTFVPDNQSILPIACPFWIDRLLAALAWVWFINLFNFMDGMDGLASGETVTVTVGIALILGLVTADTSMMVLALVLAGAAIGFLRWNWHQAHVFLGDVGSVPIGFFLGWMLIHLSLQGQFAAAIILPLYFLADATITLCKRIWRGENPTKAHRTHYYQRAHQGGLSHSEVVSRIMLVNMGLLALAISSLYWPWLTTAAAICLVALLLFVLEKVAAGPK